MADFSLLLVFLGFFCLIDGIFTSISSTVCNYSSYSSSSSFVDYLLSLGIDAVAKALTFLRLEDLSVDGGVLFDNCFLLLTTLLAFPELFCSDYFGSD